jgi:DNA mismatch repair protein MutL
LIDPVLSSTIETKGIIQVLPDRIANKIAAGEVVQRPASVVKELMENAIDAGADEVEVIVKKAGRELVQVIDNGCGMSKQDAIACFKRHATSKVSSVEDLDRIRTLGFRGEALASIAAVAQVELKTRLHDRSEGYLVEIQGGDVQQSRPCATRPGTSVAVRNLFYNVPARRNFLKTPATEFKHIVETFQFLALAYPRVAFTLVHNDNEVHHLQGIDRGDSMEHLRRRIIDLFGTRHEDRLVPVREETSYLALEGFVGRPEFSRKSSDQQFLFVNGRYVQSRYLSHAVASGYGDMLPKGSFPFFALTLTIDPKHVDVNVHPTKKKVNLDDEKGVYGFVRAVVKKALGTADITPRVGYDDEGQLVERSGGAIAGTLRDEQEQKEAGEASRAGGQGGDTWESSRPGHQRQEKPGTRGRPPGALTEELYRGIDEANIFSGAQQEERDSSDDQSVKIRLPAGEIDEESPAHPSRGDDSRLLWQLHEKYILTRIRSGLMILDQHAAHERILYETALETMEDGLGMSQQLLFSHTVEVETADFELFKELLPDLRALGFDVDVEDNEEIVVRGVPADIRVGDERTILEELLEQYKSYRDELNIQGRENLAKSIACRSAIKSGQTLSVPEMRSLIDQLFACEVPFACPHGRPTMIKVSIDELDKRFGRLGHIEREGTVE